MKIHLVRIQLRAVFYIYVWLFLYICSLCWFSSPIGGLQPAFHRNGCSLLPHPRTNTCGHRGRKSRKAPCTLSIIIHPCTTVNLHVHLASLLASVYSLYIYICIIWITMTNIDKWYLNNGGSGPLHLIGDLPQHVLFLEISGDWTIKQWQQWHSPLCTPLSTKDLKSAKHTQAKWHKHQHKHAASKWPPRPTLELVYHALPGHHQPIHQPHP